MQQPNLSLGERWIASFSNPKFRIKFIFFFFTLLITVSLLPLFFQFIETRKGLVLNDILLNHIPAHNVSLLLFVIIWSVIILSLWRAVNDPPICYLLLSSFTLLTLLRIFCLYLVPLNPPPGLIVLNDPLSNFFYGSSFITKDLFFSGHTATMFLMYLCLQKKTEKCYALSAAITVAILVLVQHIHYSIDVIAAPVFTYLIFKIARKLN